MVALTTATKTEAAGEAIKWSVNIQEQWTFVLVGSRHMGIHNSQTKCPMLTW